MDPALVSRRALLRTAVPMSCAAVAAGASFLRTDRTLADEIEPDDKKPGALTITNVETFLLRHTLPRPIGVSIAYMPVRQSLLIKISTDAGHVGWGETIDAGGTRAFIETKLKPLLVGKNPLDARNLRHAMWGANFGDGRAIGGVEIALHDVRGKALGQSLADLYGGRVRDKVLAYASAMNYIEGVDPEESFPQEAAALAKQGWRAMKIRTGRLEPRRDLAALTKVREAVGGDMRLLTDGNGAFTLPEAVKFGKELEKLDFYCFEEPLPQGLNYAGYDVLTESLDIAVAGGEVLDSRISARDRIVDRSFDIIQPDVMLCGGPAEVLFIAEMAKLWSVQCVPHCWSGAIGLAATIQVLSLLPTDTHGHSSDAPMLEFDATENPLREQLIAKPFVQQDGSVEVPTGPGLGIEVDEEVLKKYLVRE